jgi:hypothetical protein
VQPFNQQQMPKAYGIQPRTVTLKKPFKEGIIPQDVPFDYETAA